MTRWYEELEPGSQFALGSHRFTETEIIAFGQSYDPQYFHVDAEAARHAHFGGLVASGWHTACVGQKLMISLTLAEHDRRRAAGETPGVAGPSPGVNRMQFFAPVRPDDEISFEIFIDAKRVSKSLPGWGVITSSIEGTNQAEKIVYRGEFAYFAKLRDFRPLPLLAIRLQMQKWFPRLRKR